MFIWKALLDLNAHSHTIKLVFIKPLTLFLVKLVVVMASVEVLFALIRTKCLPVLLYGAEVSPTNSAIIQSL